MNKKEQRGDWLVDHMTVELTPFSGRVIIAPTSYDRECIHAYLVKYRKDLPNAMLIREPYDRVCGVNVSNQNEAVLNILMLDAIDIRNLINWYLSVRERIYVEVTRCLIEDAKIAGYDILEEPVMFSHMVGNTIRMIDVKISEYLGYSLEFVPGAAVGFFDSLNKNQINTIVSVPAETIADLALAHRIVTTNTKVSPNRNNTSWVATTYFYQ